MVLRVRELTIEEGRKLQRILRHGQDAIEFKRAQLVPNFEHRPSIEVGAETAELPGVTQTVSMGSTPPHCTGVRQRYGRRSICCRRNLRQPRGGCGRGRTVVFWAGIAGFVTHDCRIRGSCIPVEDTALSQAPARAESVLSGQCESKALKGTTTSSVTPEDSCSPIVISWPPEAAVSEAMTRRSVPTTAVSLRKWPVRAFRR